MVNDVRAFAAAEVLRINHSPPNHRPNPTQVRRINSKEAGKQRLRAVIDSRNNLHIIQHLEQYTNDFKVKNENK